MTIKDFFIKLVIKELLPECNIAVTSSEVVERVELSKTPVSVATQVSLNCDIIELTKNVRIHIYYQLKIDNDAISDIILQQDSFTILMQNTC